MQVAVLGVGHMGSHASRALARAGFLVTAYDKRVLQAEQLSQVREAPSLAEAVDGADVVILFLATDQQVLEVVDGLTSLPLGTRRPIVVCCSTISADTFEEVIRRCGTAGLPVVDAPVNGVPPNATVFAGGDDDQVEAVRPVLRAIAARVHHLGAAGAGMATKLAHQLALFGTYVMAQEALRIGTGAGVDRDALLAALLDSSASSRALERLRDGFTETELASAPVSLISKDLAHVRTLGERAGSSSAAASWLESLYQLAQADGRGSDHFSRVLDSKGSPPGDLVRRFVELWNEGRTDELGEVLADDFAWRSIDGEERLGRSAYLDGVGSAGIDITIQRLIEDGPFVMARLGIRRADGRTRTTHDLFRIHEGRIAEEWSGHG